MSPVELISEDHFGPGLSSFFVDGAGTVGFLVLVGVAVAAYWKKAREARSAEATFDKDKQLKLGQTVVAGKVERAEGAKRVVRVEVEQDGEESENSGVWSHKWTERRRRVFVEPFYLHLDSGERVRVEPSEDVFIVDQMDGMIRVNQTRRKRYAELKPGERVFASGELTRAPDPEAAPAQGYRAHREGFVLRPPARHKMLLSSEPLGARFSERARFHAMWAVWIVLGALSFHCIFIGFHARRWAGSHETATITKLDHYTTESDDSTVQHYRVWLESSGGDKLADEVEEETFTQLKQGEVVPVLVVRGKVLAAATIGPDLTVSYWALLSVPLLIGLWIAYRLREEVTRPWYEQDVVDKGRGTLEESMAKARRK
jgi:hypothetical protein